MNNKKLRLGALGIAIVLLSSVLLTPFSAFAFDEDAINLDIDTSTIELRDVWSQVKNAAIIHLIAQKMQMCVSIGQVINADDDTVWPRTGGFFTDLTSWIGGGGWAGGVLDDGNVFKGDAIVSFDVNTNIGVGTWFSSLYNDNSGIIECNDRTTGGGNLFDIFTYIYKNYKAGMDATDIEDASVTEADRLKIVCNKDDLTKPGLLQPSNGWGTPSMEACNSSAVEWYTGVSTEDQLAYIKKIYEEMRANAGNPYILSWDELGYYDEVDGYYLYSNDFEAQCGSASFVSSNKGESGYQYIAAKKIKNDGSIKSGYYEIKTDADTARQSFVVGTRTCVELVGEMNDHIKKYLQVVNKRIYDLCKTSVDDMIDEKKREITEKYLDNESAKDEEIEDANSVIDEYTRIQNDKEYMAIQKDDETKELVQVAGETEEDMPTDYVWMCREHLPYIDVVVDEEADLKEIIEDEFTDNCYKAVDLAWVVCPVIKGLSKVVDSLEQWIEEFF